MIVGDTLSRRTILAKIGMLFNGAVGAILAVPILRYILSPVIRGEGQESWLQLGDLEQFPAGETRLATFRNPVVNASDGETANIPCWVRRIAGNQFQVFAINCAHLGCPVRWFPQSGLFMCPCHGGAYYSDGSRASGPPERGLFEYAYKVEQGKLMIQVGNMPTPGAPGLEKSALISISNGISNGRPPCAS
jgi:menaquinol-cytochrome c reductase iron-sulfur subunit